MSINLELDPLTEAGLRRKAETQGLLVEDYVQLLVRQDVTMPSAESRAKALELIDSFSRQVGSSSRECLGS